MPDPFLGEIRILPYTFAPRDWAFCEGQMLPISEYSALFSLLGTAFGGDGRSTFGLPDLRGRVVLGVGGGPGLSHRLLGQIGGRESVVLTSGQMPAHGHEVNCDTQSGTRDLKETPESNLPAKSNLEDKNYGSNASAKMGNNMIQENGANQAHDNMPPYGCLRYAIALEGEYPQRP